MARRHRQTCNLADEVNRDPRPKISIRKGRGDLTSAVEREGNGQKRSIEAIEERETEQLTEQGRE